MGVEEVGEFVGEVADSEDEDEEFEEPGRPLAECVFCRLASLTASCSS